jgi:hypothetical protein
LLRHAAIVLGNQGDEASLVPLSNGSRDDDEVVREACRWAIERIVQRLGSG